MAVHAMCEKCGTVIDSGPIPLVDTHAHLTWASFGDVEAVVERAYQSGVARILTAGVDLDSSRRAVGLAERFAGVFASVGIHPTDINASDDMNAIGVLARHPAVVAIGETGLDYYHDTSTAALQRARLAEHIVLAQELDLPLVLHNREADQDVLAALRAVEGSVRVVLHCFSSSRAVAADALALGCYLSFAGNLTYRAAEALREVAAEVPGDRLLVETDSPFLSPVPHRGTRNEPAHVGCTLEALARCRHVEARALAEQIVDNARGLFSW